MFVLQVTRGPDQGKKLQLEPGRTYTIGCNEDASLVLSDPLVLKGHCSVEVTNGSVVLKNHTATAGTFVGDQKVSQANLKPNSTFRVGGTTLSVSPAPAPRPTPGPAPQAPPDALVGKIVGGYKLNELVGAGGMGKVYRATQLSLHRDVAFKILRDQHVKDKGFRDLFINEARAAAQLVHPNVVQVYDAGTEGDLVFFSMEFLGRGSIEEILEKEKKIPWEAAILQVLEAAHGLDYAESKGIVHRDIKPDNLMLNEAGQVKIADLGLAKRGEGNDDAGVIGTPHFIPPEQALGKEVDRRADLYSLGATFFRMITGKTLFTGKTAKEIVLKHIKEPPPAASSVDPSVPDDLDLVLAKMLAKEPDKRFQSAKEVIAALEEVCANHGIKGSIIRRGVGKRVLVPLLLLLLAAGGTVYYLASRGEKVVSNPEEIEARKRAEQDARDKAEEAKRSARAQRKSDSLNKLLLLEKARSDLTMETPISNVYDDPVKAPQLEIRWNAVANFLEEFGNSPVAKEFEQEEGHSSRALGQAKDIRDSLTQYKASADDMRDQQEAKLREAKDTDAKLRGMLAELRATHQYERAGNLCELVATGKPQKDDPFAPIMNWEWVSPANPAIPHRPAFAFPRIKEAVEGSRRYFLDERLQIIKEALNAKKDIDEANALPEVAETPVLQASIKKLEAIRAFRDESSNDRRVPEIGTLISEARKAQERLENLLKARETKFLRDDRMTVRELQRHLCSLDRDQTPNSMMNCDYGNGVDQWNGLLVGEKINTGLYRRFAKERIAMAGWCGFLFARFYVDLEVTAKGAGQKPFRTLDVDQVQFSDGTILQGAALTAKDSERFKFGLTKAYNRETSWRYAVLPMDQVYNAFFLYRGEPRWAAMPSEIDFALGAFCFETMQYKEAAHHFDEVLKVPGTPYEAAARSFKARAELEAKAREAYEAILREFKSADTVVAVNAVKAKLDAYAADHEGTLFYLDVMDSKDEIKIDFFSADWPEVPPAPPLPEPPD